MMTLQELRVAAEAFVEREPNSGCWLWTGSYSGKGYGAFNRNGTKYYAHRLFYEADRGPIPRGLQIDHLCRVRHCVNPAHLEAVTCRENLLRGDTSTAREAAQTHCFRGHPFNAENTYRNRGHRYCRTCLKEVHQPRKRRQYHQRMATDPVYRERRRVEGVLRTRAYRRRRLARALLEAI